MRNVRPNLAPENTPGSAPGNSTGSDPAAQPRFNVLLTEDRRRPVEHWTRQLPRLLEPQGVRAFVATSGSEALNVTRSTRIHAAVIDLATPREPNAKSCRADQPGGLWLLDVMHRLPHHPPVVVVNSRAYSARAVHRFLNDALRRGAFSVLNVPVELEDLLIAIGRIVERQYQNQWPTPEPPTPS